MALIQVFPSKVLVQIPEVKELTKEVKELTKGVNRLTDFLESHAGTGDQQTVDEFTSTLRQANQRSKQAIDRIREAIANNEH